MMASVCNSRFRVWPLFSVSTSHACGAQPVLSSVCPDVLRMQSPIHLLTVLITLVSFGFQPGPFWPQTLKMSSAHCLEWFYHVLTIREWHTCLIPISSSFSFIRRILIVFVVLMCPQGSGVSVMQIPWVVKPRGCGLGLSRMFHWRNGIQMQCCFSPVHLPHPEGKLDMGH